MKTKSANTAKKQLRVLPISISIIFFMTMYLNTSFASTLSVEWLEQVIGGLDVRVNPGSIRVDKDDNIIVCGTYSSPVDSTIAIDVAGEITGTGNFFLAKLDPSGNVIWLKTEYIDLSIAYDYSTLHYSPKLEVDGQGNIYVGGLADSLHLNNTLYSADSLVVFIAKYNTNGNLLTVKQSSPQGRYVAFNFTVDPNDNVTAVIKFSDENDIISIDGQTFTVSNPFPDAQYALLLRWNSAGNLNWGTVFGVKGSTGPTGGNLASLAMCSSAQGFTYLAVGPNDTIFSNNTYIVQPARDYTIDKLVVFDPSGNLDNARMVAVPYPGSVHLYNWASVSAVKMDHDGKLIIGGRAGGSVIIGSDTLLSSGTGGSTVNNVFAAKLDTAINGIWGRKCTGLVLTETHTINVASSGYIIFGYSQGGTSFQGNNIGRGSFVLQLDSYGNYKNHFLDSLQIHPIASADIADDGSVYAYGSFQVQTSFYGNVLIDDYSFAIDKTQDAFIAKLNLPADSVWPGDCNADGIVSAIDFFSIGLGYGYSGAVRPNATDQWVGQPCADWQNVIVGKNAKHTDADGNGGIDQYDAAPILLNFSKTHNKAKNALKAANPDLYLEADYDTCGLNTLLTIDVVASTDLTDSLYGITFQVQFDPHYVDTSTISFLYPSSWIGTVGTDLITFQHNQFSSGTVDVALARINRQNKTGTGVIARMYVVTTDNLSGGVMADLDFEINNLSGIRANGDAVALTYRGDTVVLKEGYTSVMENNLAKKVLVYPNPSTDKIWIEADGVNVEDVVVFNSLGQIILLQTSVSNSLDVSRFEQGIYFLRLRTDKGDVMKKLMRE